MSTQLVPGTLVTSADVKEAVHQAARRMAQAIKDAQGARGKAFIARIKKVHAAYGKVLGVIGKSGRNLGEFSGAHGLACPSENLIYAAETANWRVQKLILH